MLKKFKAYLASSGHHFGAFHKLLILIFVFSSILFSCAEIKEKAREKGEILKTRVAQKLTHESKELRLAVSGLKDEAEATALRGAIAKLDGVTAVQVVFKGEDNESLLFVSYNPKEINAEEIEDSITQAGYKVREENTIENEG